MAAVGVIALLVVGDGKGAVLPVRISGPGAPPPPVARPPFPDHQSLARASAYAARRQGAVALAVVDSHGRMVGSQGRRRFRSASVVKAMILVAYLDRLARRGEKLSIEARERLDLMIRRSDNAAATILVSEVGVAGLRRVARRAGMRGFVPVLVPWGRTKITAEDQARLFAQIDQLLPARHRAYARKLLSGIVAEQRWGLPDAATRGATVLFKGGWIPAADGTWTVHQAGRLESGRGDIAVAVLTEGNPSEAYGRQTVREVARRLVDPGSTPAD